MTRQTYGNGHTLTGLREWARELAGKGHPVKGYTRMGGEALAAAVEAANRAMLRDLETRNMSDLMGRPLVPGMMLIAECGCRIVATTGVLAWDGDGRFADDPSLYVEGNYVELCARCTRDHPAGPEHMNKTQDVCLAGPMGRRYRFFLHNHTVVDSEATVQSIDRGVPRTRERCLCPATDLVESGMSNCRHGCKTFTCGTHRSEPPRVLHNAAYGCRAGA